MTLKLKYFSFPANRSEYQEQPINYSMRYQDSPPRDVVGSGAEVSGDTIEAHEYQDEAHCVECKYAEARRANEQLDNSSNDDQVRTFFTEGTPFLSTATSLTDLTGGQGIDEEDEDEREVHQRSNGKGKLQ